MKIKDKANSSKKLNSFEQFLQDREELKEHCTLNSKCYTVGSLIAFLEQYDRNLPVYFNGSIDYNPAHSSYVEIEKVRKTSRRPARVEITVHHEWNIESAEATEN
jgi:hypothetical protein